MGVTMPGAWNAAVRGTRFMGIMPILFALFLAAAQAPDTVDVLLAGGMVYDGGGSPGRIADVGVRGDRITFFGAARPGAPVARRRIDVRGLIVAPGFIDPHTHSFEGLPGVSLERRRNAGALMQGVTTVVLGADGRGPLDVARVLAESERAGIGTNTYAMAGFGTARGRVLGASSAPATPAQVDSMRTLIAAAMREGAFGVGAGLFYAPQFYSSTDEVITVLKGASPYGGVYDSHQRDESSYTIGLLNSVREAIRIGKETGLTTNIGHVKALGVDVWPSQALWCIPAEDPAVCARQAGHHDGTDDSGLVRTGGGSVRHSGAGSRADGLLRGPHRLRPPGYPG
jgi:N-acyl-D-aspartate/D-glutamate deacylase